MFRQLNRTAVSRIFRIIISLLVALSMLPVLSMSAGAAQGDAESGSDGDLGLSGLALGHVGVSFGLGRCGI